MDQLRGKSIDDLNREFFREIIRFHTQLFRNFGCHLINIRIGGIKEDFKCLIEQLSIFNHLHAVPLMYPILQQHIIQLKAKLAPFEKRCQFVA